MPAPKKPNTAAATAAVRWRGDLTAAARLRKHGWLVLAPDDLKNLPAEIIAQIDEATPERPTRYAGPVAEPLQ